MAHRDPEMLTSYLCSFCRERIKWGEIVRMLRREPGQPDYEGRESYSHLSCLRSRLDAAVPLTFPHDGPGTIAWPDDAVQLRGKSCGFCSKPIKPHQRIKLRLQRPVGTVKRPLFIEEWLKVHKSCWLAATRSKS
jgi:hypothetical protein